MPEPHRPAPHPHETLLVIDAAGQQRALLERHLEERGYRVVTARSGAVALDLIARETVSLALLCVATPDTDCAALLARLHQLRTSAELPVIMVSAGAEDFEAALTAGADDLVATPIDAALLFSRVEMHLARQRAEMALRRSEERFALAVQVAQDGIWDWDFAADTLFLSARWKQLIGFGEDELPAEPQSWFGRVHPDDRLRLEAAIAAVRRGDRSHLAVEHRVLHRDGAYRWMLARGVAQSSAQGVVRLTGSQTDLTDRKLVDPVTGLPNRAVFQQKLAEMAPPDGARGDGRFALLLCNLDRFKLVNDSLGLQRGDQALATIAKLLRDCLRDVGFLAHLGADEFAILVGGGCSPAEALQLADTILETMRAPLAIEGEVVEISASVGIALSGAGGGEAALRDAQVALSRAKQAGGDKVELFEAKMQQDARRRLDLERDLRQALRKNELFPAFQPIVSLIDGSIIGFEALARWNRAGHGSVSPAEFIPIAEETGLIKTIDQQILAQACLEARRWHAPRRPPPLISVNLSAKQIGDPGLVAATLAQLQRHGLSPGQLKLEITESAIMDDPEAAARVIAELVEHGIGLAIDDFGTGYCSLAYLHRFPADTLKIDRYFIAQMDGGAQGLGIVGAIIDLAHGLGMAVVAEGIETVTQRDALRQLGCDYGQGFLFSRPVSADAAFALLGTALAA